MTAQEAFYLGIAIAPFFFTTIGIFIRVETSIATMKNDICWLKQKALERRQADKFS